jgi:hypothetical protein
MERSRMVRIQATRSSSIFSSSGITCGSDRGKGETANMNPYLFPVCLHPGRPKAIGTLQQLFRQRLGTRAREPEQCQIERRRTLVPYNNDDPSILFILLPRTDRPAVPTEIIDAGDTRLLAASRDRAPAEAACRRAPGPPSSLAERTHCSQRYRQPGAPPSGWHVGYRE